MAAPAVDRRHLLPDYVSVSQRATLRRCPQKFEWAYLDKLRPIRDANALWFGQILHIALAEWYLKGIKRGPHPAETFERLVQDEERFIPTDYVDDEVKLEDAKTLGMTMLNGYVEKYGKDEDQIWIATESEFRVGIARVGYRLRKGQEPLVWLYGVFDGVYRDANTGELWLMEHKGFKDSSTKHLPLDDQGGTYLMAATLELRRTGVLKPKESITGVNYNILRKAMPPKPGDDFDEEGFKLLKPKKDDAIRALQNASIPFDEKMGAERLIEFAREAGLTVRGQRAKGQPAPLFIREPIFRTSEEMAAKYRQIRSEALFRDAIASGALPVFKNQTKDCGWDCQFFRMCQLHEAGEDWEMFRDEMYITREQAEAERLAREERKAA